MITEQELSAIFAANAEPSTEVAPFNGAAEPNPGEKLRHNIALALDRQRELLELGVDPENHRQNRLVADVVHATLKTGLQADSVALQARREDLWEEIYDRLIVEKVKLGRELSAAERQRLPQACERLGETPRLIDRIIPERANP